MKEKPKKSVRMWVARDKDGSLYLYKNKPTEKQMAVILNGLQHHFM